MYFIFLQNKYVFSPTLHGSVQSWIDFSNGKKMNEIQHIFLLTVPSVKTDLSRIHSLHWLTSPQTGWFTVHFWNNWVQKNIYPADEYIWTNSAMHWTQFFPVIALSTFWTREAWLSLLRSTESSPTYTQL